ncbi:MAG: hypothetical protein JNM63_08570 [Spirochaetia bacterium]|nr:hypothetical protein [Spirochaetia bacterium]
MLVSGHLSASNEELRKSGVWNLPGPNPHLVAHYMPWFAAQKISNHAENAWVHWKWTEKGPVRHPTNVNEKGLRNISSVYYPLIGPYNSWDPSVIRYHLKTAKAAGIQAFLLDWYGPGRNEDVPVQALLDEANKLDMRIAICYEEKINFPPYLNPTNREMFLDNVTSDLSYVLTRYGSHPAYLKRNNVPFVYQFNGFGTGKIGAKYLKPVEWKKVFENLPGPVSYGRQGLDSQYYPTLQGAYLWWTMDPDWIDRFTKQAVELKKAGNLEYFISMICPGFDDTGVWGWGGGPRKVDRCGLSILRDTMDRSLAGDPELVQIVTWNDFEEGTVVEPTRDFGYWYLDAIETWWGEKTGRPVDLNDNREPFREYASACSGVSKGELPADSWDAYLVCRKLEVEHSNILINVYGKKK